MGLGIALPIGYIQQVAEAYPASFTQFFAMALMETRLRAVFLTDSYRQLAQRAEAYLQALDAHHYPPPQTFVAEAYRQLLGLNLALVDYDPPSERYRWYAEQHTVAVPEEALRIRERISQHLGDNRWYWETLDPFYPQGDTPAPQHDRADAILGNLADDLYRVYFGLKMASLHLAEGSDAATEFGLRSYGLGFRNDWGEALTDALRPLKYLVYHYPCTPQPTPTRSEPFWTRKSASTTNPASSLLTLFPFPIGFGKPKT